MVPSNFRKHRNLWRLRREGVLMSTARVLRGTGTNRCTMKRFGVGGLR